MWSFFVAKRVTYGKGSLKLIVEDFDSFPGNRPLFVLSNRALGTAPIREVLKLFDERNIPYGISTQVVPEAPVECVGKIFGDFKTNGCDSIIAVGGGSVIDLAKAAAILTTNGGRIEDYYGLHAVPKPTVPKILVPTTSGTGSEATNIIVLGDKKQKSKKGIVSHHLFADWAIIDPTLTYSMPRELVLATGLDAFCQCLEAFTSKNTSPMVDLYALKGMELISQNLQSSMDGIEEARDAMSLGAYLSGVVISGGNAGTNLGHAIGNTIGGMYTSAHGLSVTAVSEQVVRFNAKAPAYSERLAEIKKRIGLDVVQFIQELREQVGIPTLNNMGVKEEEIPEIAGKVISDQQRLLRNNQRDVSQEDVEGILRASL
jgi:alcohol dehydrogenase class IV